MGQVQHITESMAQALYTKLEAGAHSLGVALGQTQKDTLLNYLKLLVKWNKAYNLTAVRDPESMLINHILDSLSIFSFIPNDSDCLDVGTGPGLPGLILAIACPTTKWTLVDSNGKKTRFVEQAISELNISNAKVYQERIESLACDTLFDIITTRAFSDLPDIVDKTQRLLKPNGMILAMKGTCPKEELQNLSLHGKVHPIQVPYMDKQRTLVCLTGSSRG